MTVSKLVVVHRRQHQKGSMSLLSPTPSPVPSFTVSSFSSSSSSSPSSLFASSTPIVSPTTDTSTSTSSSSSPTYPTSSSTATSASAALSTSSASTSLAVDQPSSSVTLTTTTSAGILSSATVSNALALTSSSATPSSTPTHSSSSDFFSNTGAVAGTFTVVGLVGIALVIALVMFIIKRHARAHEEDAEFFDKNPDFSDPPINRVTSMDDISSSDHTHYGALPMALPPPPVFYPDHVAQTFQAESFPQPPSHGYPAGYTQQYPAQYIYTPEDYDIGYPPVAPHGNPNLHGFAGMQIESAPVPLAQAALPDTIRRPTKSTLTVPAPSADSRFSVDSFYSGIAQDSTTTTGQAF